MLGGQRAAAVLMASKQGPSRLRSRAGQHSYAHALGTYPAHDEQTERRRRGASPAPGTAMPSPAPHQHALLQDGTIGPRSEARCPQGKGQDAPRRRREGGGRMEQHERRHHPEPPSPQRHPETIRRRLVLSPFPPPSHKTPVPHAPTPKTQKRRRESSRRRISFTRKHSPHGELLRLLEVLEHLHRAILPAHRAFLAVRVVAAAVPHHGRVQRQVGHALPIQVRPRL